MLTISEIHRSICSDRLLADNEQKQLLKRIQNWSTPGPRQLLQPSDYRGEGRTAAALYSLEAASLVNFTVTLADAGLKGARIADVLEKLNADYMHPRPAGNHRRSVWGRCIDLFEQGGNPVLFIRGTKNRSIEGVQVVLEESFSVKEKPLLKAIQGAGFQYTYTLLFPLQRELSPFLERKAA